MIIGGKNEHKNEELEWWKSLFVSASHFISYENKRIALRFRNVYAFFTFIEIYIDLWTVFQY